MDRKLQFGLNNPAPDPPLKVLIVRIGSMGDVLHALPAAAALRERLPDCILGWAIEPRWQDLLVSGGATDAEAGSEVMPIVSRVHLAPTLAWKRQPLSPRTILGISRLRRELKEEAYDVCVDLQGSIKSAVIGKMAQTETFLGPARPREAPAARLYKERVGVDAAHVIEQACELLTAALTDSRDPSEVLRPTRVRLPVNAAAEAWCEGRISELGVGNRGFVLLAPTAGWGAKQWPVDKYREVAARLADAGYRVLVNAGSAADAAVTGAVVAGGKAVVVEAGIAELIALTRRARLVIGGDTGPVHLAAALGRPVVGLYGPTDPRRNGPYFPGSRVRVLQHATSRLDYARHAQTESGLAKITEDDVVTASFKLLEEGPAEPLPPVDRGSDPGFGGDRRSERFDG